MASLCRYWIANTVSKIIPYLVYIEYSLLGYEIFHFYCIYKNI